MAAALGTDRRDGDLRHLPGVGVSQAPLRLPSGA